MSNAIMIEKFAARHGATKSDIFAGDGTFGGDMKSSRLQSELSHYEMGWSACLQSYDTEAQAFAAGNAAYEKMTAWNTGMGQIDRQEYVAGFVACSAS